MFILNQVFAIKDQSMCYILEITSMVNMGNYWCFACKSAKQIKTTLILSFHYNNHWSFEFEWLRMATSVPSNWKFGVGIQCGFSIQESYSNWTLKVTFQNNPIWGITSGHWYIFLMLEICSKSQLIYCTTGQEHNGNGIVFEIYPLIL